MTTEPCANAIERDPSYADDNLIWIDMEMTGLQPRGESRPGGGSDHYGQEFEHSS